MNKYYYYYINMGVSFSYLMTTFNLLQNFVVTNLLHVMKLLNLG